MQEKAKLTSTQENPSKPVPAPGSTQSKLKKSFKRAILPILNSVFKEEFCKAFQSCTNEEQRRLHQLFLKILSINPLYGIYLFAPNQVITALHGNIEEFFESLCDEMQVGAALDAFDHLVEEQSLDLLMTDKTNVLDAVRTLSMARNGEVQSLTRCLEKAEEHNRQLKTRIELLKKQQQDFLVAANSIEKLTRAVNYKRSEASNSWEEMVASAGIAPKENESKLL